MFVYLFCPKWNFNLRFHHKIVVARSCMPVYAFTYTGNEWMASYTFNLGSNNAIDYLQSKIYDTGNQKMFWYLCLSSKILNRSCGNEWKRTDQDGIENKIFACYFLSLSLHFNHIFIQINLIWWFINIKLLI